MHIPQPILDRYDALILAIAPYPVECQEDPGTSYPHLRWMLRTIPTHADPFKANRWLAFVQGVLIERGLTTVPAERDFTRPYFSSRSGSGPTLTPLEWSLLWRFRDGGLKLKPSG